MTSPERRQVEQLATPDQAGALKDTLLDATIDGYAVDGDGAKYVRLREEDIPAEVLARMPDPSDTASPGEINYRAIMYSSSGEDGRPATENDPYRMLPWIDFERYQYPGGNAQYDTRVTTRVSYRVVADPGTGLQRIRHEVDVWTGAASTGSPIDPAEFLSAQEMAAAFGIDRPTYTEADQVIAFCKDQSLLGK